MGTFLSWKGTDTSEGGSLEFDVTLMSSITKRATPTSLPVERGANVSDHVREELDSVSLEVFVSNSPISPKNNVNPADTRGFLNAVVMDVATYTPPLNSLSRLISKIGSLFSGPKPKPKALLLSFPSEFSAPTETFDVLTQLLEEKRLVNVFARDWIADDMVITSVTNPQTFEEGDGAKISIELQHIRIVETVRVTSPVSEEPRAKSPVSAGKKDPKGASPPMRSVAKATVKAAAEALPSIHGGE
jgi:hypothetical protein